MSQTWSVNLVSAFGRGETLALALQENGFQVRILDFTEALPEEYHRGLGPFPIVKHDFLPAQKEFLNEVRPLPGSISFWLPDGPVELGGRLGLFYSDTRSDVKTWREDSKATDFNSTWLRRFLRQWAAPYYSESWKEDRQAIFPAELELGLIDHAKEPMAASFEHFADLGHQRTSCKKMESVVIESRRIQQLDGWKSDQWIWCLSGHETKAISEKVAGQVFPHGPSEPQWVWLSMNVRHQHGPWSNGIPDYTVILNDLYLPWTHTNLAILRRLEQDVYRCWLRVPFTQAADPAHRGAWAQQLRASLEKRLPMAKWQIESQRYSVCPHSPVYSPELKDNHGNNWKNWDWIAPESLVRLDYSARLESEAFSFQRLTEWRNDQIKKQGASRDQALHPS